MANVISDKTKLENVVGPKTLAHLLEILEHETDLRKSPLYQKNIGAWETMTLNAVSPGEMKHKIHLEAIKDCGYPHTSEKQVDINIVKLCKQYTNHLSDEH